MAKLAGRSGIRRCGSAARAVPGQDADLRPRRVAARMGRGPAHPGGTVEMEDHLDVGEAVQPERGVAVHLGRVQVDP